ncbi:MAG: hypothetical protein ABID83_00990 [Candidatus Omnitrophota bacterium]
MMCTKLHNHKVTINDKRREKKKTNDMMKRSTSKQDLQKTFDAYYRDQVRALYRAVAKGE